MTIREPEKSLRYIASLDTARCQGNWPEVPELVRKITKHAPHRKCLIQTAEAECQVAAHINKRPSTAKSTASAKSPGLTELIAPLLSAIEDGTNYPQDVFQAQVCLGWIHWTLSEPGLAASRLPKDFNVTVQSLSSGEEPLSPWTEVCIIKGGYMKGAAHALVSSADDAIKVFSSIIPRVTSTNQQVATCPQYLFWSEQLFAKCAVLGSQEVSELGNRASEQLVGFTLKSFRLWAAHSEVKRLSSSSGPTSDLAPRASIWKAYYTLLSAVIQNGVPYVPPAEGPSRVQLSTEFRKVESACENALLRDVKFPRASTANHQVDDWVELVIRNWEVLFGPEWNDEDFGEGGQDAVGRNVLDVLYRAATKTFHSPLILRRLFHVHASLTDFDLAMKAFDTYLDIVTKAKERANKTAEAQEQVEADNIFLRTISEGILVLCCFGSQKEAEKAKSLADTLSVLLENDEIKESHHANGRRNSVNSESESSDEGMPSAKTKSLAYRAVGIALANWARWTPFSETRDEIQADAIANLEKSLDPDFGEDTNAATVFALGLLLAETRDVNGAIEYVKVALASHGNPSHFADTTKYSQERDLIPLWHLLALLLSAREDFEISGRTCEAALEQFPSPAVLFGHLGRNHSRPTLTETRGLVDEMTGREKERILEIRMTQLALTEVLEGPEAAVNHSDEVLGLFGRLFRHLGLESETEEKQKQENLVPPKSSAGTVRSFRGSIFGRKRGMKSTNEAEGDGSNREAFPVSRRASLAPTEAPTIQVTGEDGQGGRIDRPVASRHSNSIHHREGRPLQKLQKRDASSSRARSREKTQHPEEPTSPDQVGVAITADGPSPTSPMSPTSQSSRAKQPLPPVAHNMPHTREPPPAGHSKQPPEQDVRLPTNGRFNSATGASTRFTKTQLQKHAIGMLVKVWLVIASLYRRASLYEDAREACEEAAKEAANVEGLIASQDSSARAFAEEGWGPGKSSEQLWGDVYSERGLLAQAQSRPYEAMEHLEKALMHFPNHSEATVALANMLLEIYDQTLPPEPPQPKLEANMSSLSLSSPATNETGPKEPNITKNSELVNGSRELLDTKGKPCSIDNSPEGLNRLAARDRAYGLLSSLTKLGSSWDNSEAWLALARAYEAGGQVEKAKEVLWWCIELEDRKPIRHWWNLGSGGYVL